MCLHPIIVRGGQRVGEAVELSFAEEVHHRHVVWSENNAGYNCQNDHRQGMKGRKKEKDTGWRGKVLECDQILFDLTKGNYNGQNDGHRSRSNSERSQSSKEEGWLPDQLKRGEKEREQPGELWGVGQVGEKMQQQ